jgi:hypothetical protein
LQRFPRFLGETAFKVCPAEEVAQVVQRAQAAARAATPCQAPQVKPVVRALHHLLPAPQLCMAAVVERRQAAQEGQVGAVQAAQGI